MSHAKELLRFLKANDSLITVISGKEYKLSQEQALEASEALLNTGWLSTEDFLINPVNIASVEKDGKGTKTANKKSGISSKATGSEE